MQLDFEQGTRCVLAGRSYGREIRLDYAPRARAIRLDARPLPTPPVACTRPPTIQQLAPRWRRRGCRQTMAPARRRVSYIIPPPADPVPRLQLPPHGASN